MIEETDIERFQETDIMKALEATQKIVIKIIIDHQDKEEHLHEIVIT